MSMVNTRDHSLLRSFVGVLPLTWAFLQMPNKRFNPSGGLGGISNQRFLAAAGLTWVFALRGNFFGST